jgi:hypothetical protein
MISCGPPRSGKATPSAGPTACQPRHAGDACAAQQRTEHLGLRLTAGDLNENDRAGASASHRFHLNDDKLVGGTHRSRKDLATQAHRTLLLALPVGSRPSGLIVTARLPNRPGVAAAGAGREPTSLGRRAQRR